MVLNSGSPRGPPGSWRRGVQQVSTQSDTATPLPTSIFIAQYKWLKVGLLP